MKIAILEGKVAGVVFFDFTDAFGNVNRHKLIDKLWNTFKIKGKLFLHLQDFLNKRSARIRVTNLTGQWKASEWGTSAGTVLGALLFIMHVFDAPEEVDPKYADDFTTVAIADSVKEVENQLHASVNPLCQWVDNNDMLLNVPKTKAMMLFGKSMEVRTT